MPPNKQVPKNVQVSPRQRVKPPKPSSGAAPGEPNPSKPKPDSGALQDRGAYKSFANSLKTKGQQPGEKQVIAEIAARRRVSLQEARAIAERRTARGQNVNGMRGPKNMKPAATTGGPLGVPSGKPDPRVKAVRIRQPLDMSTGKKKPPVGSGKPANIERVAGIAAKPRRVRPPRTPRGVIRG